ncbi:MAG TPA: Mrp/NBP35 family ATP-binding protein [Gemmatimonadaceae bacterium]|jgi:ATP-binding protein involved in chromosome partitioning|nr:Mrp/NBP35 family ATP-binding protein [Gemmatimonadaceae bacterium]
MSANLQDRIADALSHVRNNRLGANVLEAEMVKDIATTTDGRVRLTLFLSPEDNATVVREVRQALQLVEGVTDVRVDVKDASQGNTTARPNQQAPKPAAAHAPKPGASRALPVMGQEPQSQRAAVPAPTPIAYPHLGNVVAISSGKGGVGKSTVATNLAVALAQQGARVGLMDADIYGPNIPRMMGVNGAPPVENEKIIPLQAHGVKIMSLGFMIERDQPAIWRGPIIMKIITQFLRDVQWGELDYFLVDMPPGTGDAQLSLVQATMVHGAIIVTTPQEVASGDALRGAKMFQRVAVPVLGVVENMSYFICPHCEQKHLIFGSGGGKRLAEELDVPLLGEIPFFPAVLSGADRGDPIVVSEPATPAAKALIDLAGRLSGLLSGSDTASVNAALR